jgi:RNA polymerase sigma factor (sigma-70 family)
MFNEQQINEIYNFVYTCLSTIYANRVKPWDRDDYHQNILEKILHQAHRYNPNQGTISQWVGKLIKNFIIDQERKPRRFNLTDDFSFLTDAAENYDLQEDELFMDRLIFYQGFMNEETFENQEMMRLFYIQGLSDREISALLHVAENQLPMQRKRLKDRIKRAIRNR